MKVTSFFASGALWIGPALVLLAALLSARAARAERIVRLSLVGPLPFTPGEIEQAVAARLTVAAGGDASASEEATASASEEATTASAGEEATDAGGVADAVVGPAHDDGVAVRLGRKRRTIALAGRHGTEAARLVALTIADLAADELDPAPAPPPPVEAAVVRPAPAAPPAATPAGPLGLSALTEAAKGTGAAEPALVGVAAEVTAPVGALLVAASLGVSRAGDRHVGLVDAASFSAATARLSLGWRSGGAFEVLGGAFAEPYDLGGGVRRTGILYGGGVATRIAPALWKRLRLVAYVRLDAFANRIQVSLAGRPPSFATPRVAGAMGLGLRWDLGP